MSNLLTPTPPPPTHPLFDLAVAIVREQGERMLEEKRKRDEAKKGTP